MSAEFSHSVTLTPYGLEWLKNKLAKWPEVQIEATQIVTKKGGDGIDADDEVIRFETRVSLNAPVIPSHKLLARIEHMEEGNIIYRCAGTEKPEYRTCKPWCDHCKTSRRRNDTFVLLDETTNREKQVGRNCLAEYVRDAGAAQYLLSWADTIDRMVRVCSDAEEGFGSGKVPETYTLPFVVSWAMAYGGKWVSSSVSRETGEIASAHVVLDMIDRLRMAKKGDRWLGTREGQQAEATRERAKTLREDESSDVYAVLRWIDSLRAKADTELTDYEHNLIVLSRVGYVTRKQWSFACSAFRAWLRAQHIARGEEEKRVREAAPVTGNHVGTVGERMGVAACNCVLVKSLGIGEFGERFLIKFTTPAGDDVTWFTNNPSEFEAGKAYDVTFTVKEHGEFAKRRNTVVQRVTAGLPKTKKPRTKKPAV